jgi:hypothetical protein
MRYAASSLAQLKTAAPPMALDEFWLKSLKCGPNLWTGNDGFQRPSIWVRSSSILNSGFGAVIWLALGFLNFKKSPISLKIAMFLPFYVMSWVYLSQVNPSPENHLPDR